MIKKPTHAAMVAAGTLLLAVVLFFLEMPGLTQSARLTLILFFVAAIFWMTELIPLYVTSLIILAYEIIWLSPVMSREGMDGSIQQFMSPFFSNIILLFLGGLLLSQAGSKYRLDRWIASMVLRIVGQKPANVLLGIIFTSAWLSMWMSNTATTAMMLIIALAITKQIPAESAQFKKAFFLAVPFACNLGGMGTPVGSPPNAIAIGFLHKNGIDIAFHTWMMLALPIVAILLFLLWRLLLISFPAPKQDLATLERVSIPSGWKSKATLAIFAVTTLLWLTSQIHGMQSGTVALLATIALMGLNILDSKDFRNLSWDILYLVGGGVSLGVAMSKSGLSAYLVQILPMDGLALPVIIIALVVVGSSLTTFMSNTATANILIPLALSLPTQHTPLLIAVALSVSGSMTLPVSTPSNAIAYYSGEINLKDMIGNGIIISIAASIFVFLAAIFYWQWIGLY